MNGYPRSPGGRRLKVLLIAYACEPDCGSEPGTGWNTALGLAACCEVTVVTRANNRGPVEAALAALAEGDRPRFLFLDPPFWTLRLKARGLMPTQIFYYFWQRAVARHLRPGDESFDVVHQLTFNSFEVPPLVFGWLGGVKVWGPVGGGQTVPGALLRVFGSAGARKEAWRNRRVRFSARTPWVRRVLRSSDLVLFANAETRDLLGSGCAGETGMMIDVGVDVRKFRPGEDRANEDGPVFLAAGRLDPRKGMALLVEAFAGLVEDHPGASLRIVGDGPERLRLEAEVAARGLQGQVTLTGAVSHEAMRREFETADVFVFPSLRDTSGAVVLEAMAMALPVVCLDHQGAALMVEDGCGLRVRVGSYRETHEGLREALRRMAADPVMRRRCGARGREVAEARFDWKVKVARISERYQALCLPGEARRERRPSGAGTVGGE